MSFNSKIYGSKKVKDELRKMSCGKCAYCDAPVEAVAHGDVEHFRPKSVYWWLAYTWENFLFSCQICNQSFKKDEFPIKGRRARNPGDDLSAEAPLLINPLDEDPGKFISYDELGDHVSIVPRDAGSVERVEACNRYFGLNRDPLLRLRQKTFKELALVKAIYDEDASPESRRLCREHLKDMSSDSAPFAGMVRFYLGRWNVAL